MHSRARAQVLAWRENERGVVEKVDGDVLEEEEKRVELRERLSSSSSYSSFFLAAWANELRTCEGLILKSISV